MSWTGYVKLQERRLYYKCSNIFRAYLHLWDVKDRLVRSRAIHVPLCLRKEMAADCWSRFR